MPTRGQAGMPFRQEDWEAAGLTKKAGEEKEEDLPFNWGPGTENAIASGNKDVAAVSQDVGPTEEEWEKSTVRGFSRRGEECRVVRWYDHGLKFVVKYENGFSYIGEQAFAERPSLVERLGMGQVVGYNLLDPEAGFVEPPNGRWLILGKVETHRGVTPAWIAKRLGLSQIVEIIRHCRVIDIGGNDVPLKGW